MANPTTNYSFAMPTNTDLVKDLPADFEIFGQAVDTKIKDLSPETTAGDMAYRGATANARVRLPIGTANQQLRVNSTATAPEWFTATAGGMTLISTTTLSGSSVTLSSIPQTYKHLQLVSRNFKPATDNAYAYIRVNGDSTANRYLKREFSQANADGVTFGSSSWDFYNGQDNGTATGLGIMDIFDYTNTTTWKMATNLTVFNNATTTTQLNQWKDQLWYNQTSAITSLEITVSTGTFTSGEVLLYGVS
jgi:hypothetical protein